MLALGRGLMARADLLMIDEPSLGLAPVLVDEVYATDRDHRSRRADRAAGRGELRTHPGPRRHHRSGRERTVSSGEAAVDEVLNDEAVVQTYLGIGGRGHESISADHRQHDRPGLDVRPHHHRYDSGLRHATRAQHGAGRHGDGGRFRGVHLPPTHRLAGVDVTLRRGRSDVRHRCTRLLPRGSAAARPGRRRLRDDSLHHHVRHRHRGSERHLADVRPSAEAVRSFA